uniref:Sec-independent protein translocase protein TATB, chloroplastic n=1 Tax=Oryza nivara TaxID=4536 RepID=A0A0E0J3M3_ORYNI
MAVAGLLLRPPPCVAMCTPSPSPFPSSQRRRRRRLTLAQPYCTLGLSFVSGRHHRFLLRRRRRTESKRTSRGTGVYASLFGVGAPEALVIGVVALLVFGPKGLAEVARNLGKTLRAFQPTIRELQDVSREFRSTLEREIGLDEVPPSMNYRPPTMNNSQQPAIDQSSDDKPEAAPYTSEELIKVTEEQLAASAAAAWNTQEPPPSQQKGFDIFFVPFLQLEAAATSESNDGAISRGSDGAGAAMSEPNRNISEKTETER